MLAVAARLEELEDQYKDIKFEDYTERPNPRKNAAVKIVF